MKIFKKIIKIISIIIIIFGVVIFGAGFFNHSETKTASAAELSEERAAPNPENYPTANLFDLSGANSAGGVTVTTNNNTITFNGTTNQDYINFISLDITNNLIDGQYYTMSYYKNYNNTTDVPVFQTFETSRSTGQTNYLTASSDNLIEAGYYSFPAKTTEYTYTLYIIAGINPQTFDCSYNYMFNIGETAYPYIPTFQGVYDEGFADGEQSINNNGFNQTVISLNRFFEYGPTLPGGDQETYNFYTSPLVNAFGTQTADGGYYSGFYNIGTTEYGNSNDIIQRFEFSSGDSYKTSIINNYGNSRYVEFPNTTVRYYFETILSYLSIEFNSKYMPSLEIKVYDYNSETDTDYTVYIPFTNVSEIKEGNYTAEQFTDLIYSYFRNFSEDIIYQITWNDIYMIEENLITPGEYYLNSKIFSDIFIGRYNAGYEAGYNRGVTEGTKASEGFLISISTVLTSLFNNMTTLLSTEIAPGLNIGLFVIGIPVAFLVLDLIISLILKFLGKSR